MNDMAWPWLVIPIWPYADKRNRQISQEYYVYQEKSLLDL